MGAPLEQVDADSSEAKRQPPIGAVANPTVWSERLGKNAVKTGVFGEYMDVMIRNDGPCTIIADSEESVARPSSSAPVNGDEKKTEAVAEPSASAGYPKNEAVGEP